MDLVCNFADQIAERNNREENLDHSMEGDTQDLIIYLILKEKERIRNTVQGYTF